MTALAASEVVLSQNRAYDGRGNLEREWQAHGGTVNTGTTPSVAYTWSFSPLTEGNYDRLTSMAYPQWAEGGGRRLLTFDYGSGLDDALSRVAGITDSDYGTLAEYGYGGLSRRISSTLGNGITQTVAEPGGYSGLDQHGRMADLHFTAGGATLHQYQYGYDLAGNP